MYYSFVALQLSHVFFYSFFPEFPPSTPSPESVRHKDSASTMRGSASDGDSLFSQDLGEDSAFNNKVGVDLSCVSHITQFCVCFLKQSCYLFCFYVSLPCEEPSLVPRPDKAIL